MRMLLAAAVLSLVGSGPPAAGVETLYRDSHGPIAAFAQDGTLLAWFSVANHRCNAVHLLSLAGVAVTLPKPGTSNVTCRWDVGTGPVGLAVAERAGGALWTLHEQAPIEFDYVVGTDLKQPLERRFSQVGHTRRGIGLWLGGIAGNGTTLVYTVSAVVYANQVECLSGGPCRLRIGGGAVHEIVGRRDSPLPGTGPALAVAAAGDRIAYVPAVGVDSQGRPAAGPNAKIQVRAAGTGDVVGVVEPHGVPIALALAPNVLAVLERSGGALHVSWYDPADGSRLGSMPVPPTTSPVLAASDEFAVYRVGRVVHGIDLALRRDRTLVTAAAAPIGLSLVGDRLAWAENVDDKGRIRALVLGGAS